MEEDSIDTSGGIAILVREEAIRFVESMKPTDHVIFFYDTVESKCRILFNFLDNGLANRKGAAYVCSEENPEQIRSRMESHGIDIKETEKEGKLIIRNYDGWYIENGEVEYVKILAGWRDIYNEFRKRGFGLRGAGEMACFFKHNKVRELLRYEYALHRVLDIPMESICAYDVNTIVETGYTEIMMPLVRAHGWAIFTGPGGEMVYQAGNVEDYDIEKLLQVKL